MSTYYTLSGQILEKTGTPYSFRSSGTRFGGGLRGLGWRPMCWDEIANRLFQIVYEAQLRGTSSQRRSKRILRRKIWSNFVKGRTTFLTLTFQENQVDYQVSFQELKKFLKRLSYHFLDKEHHGQKFSYIVVPEQQKRGAWHFHLMLFDVPFLSSKDVASLWGNGFIKINSVFGNPDHAANYLLKYFSKSFGNVEYRRRYSCSQNLEKSYVCESDFLEKNLQELYNFEMLCENYDGYFYYGKIQLTSKNLKC